jgi:hypothetical protein
MDKPSFDAHPLWTSLDELDAVVGLAEQKEVAGTESVLNELRYLVSLLRSHAEPSDSAPYSTVGLGLVQAHLPNIANEVTNFVSNDNVAHLSNAQNYADQALNAVGAWPTNSLKGGAAAQANKVFAEFRESADEALSALRASNVELRSQLTDQQAVHDSAVAAVKAELAGLSSKITSDEARLDTALTTNNEVFTTKQTEREEKFKAFVEEQGAALKNLAAQDLQEISDRLTSATERYEEIDALREGTEKVAGLASADILAGKYSEYSEQQWKWGVGANVLGFITLAIGIGLVVKTVSSVTADERITWQYTALKLGITLTIVAASAVAFRLGGTFLSRSSANKRTELELRAIGPFFADIDDEVAVRDAKKAFVERSFGQAHSSGGLHLSTSEATNLLQEIRELVRAVTSKAP